MPKMLLLAKLERMASIRHQLGTGLPGAKTRTRTGTNAARAGVVILAIELTIAAIEEQLPSSRYYSRSLSRTSGILLLPRFSGPPRGSRGTSSAERERALREDPLGTPPSLSAKKVSENLEKVPRILEVEGPGGPK